MKIRRKSVELSAVQIMTQTMIRFAQTPYNTTVAPNSWLIFGPGGVAWMSDEEFQKEYDIVPS